MLPPAYGPDDLGRLESAYEARRVLCNFDDAPLQGILNKLTEDTSPLRKIKRHPFQSLFPSLISPLQPLSRRIGLATWTLLHSNEG